MCAASAADLARLGHRGRIDRLDDFDTGSHDLAHAERDATRVDEQRGGRWQGGQRSCRLGVRRDLDAVGGQAGLQSVLDLAVGDEQARTARVEQQVRDEHRVVADVGAAQVGEPRDVVQRRNEVVSRPGLAHVFAHGGKLRAAWDGRVRRHMFIDRRDGQRRTVGPDLGQDVEIGAHADALGGQRRLECAACRQREDGAVDGDRVAALQRRREPLDMREAGRTRQLHQFHAGPGQLHFSLRPVAAVDPHPRGIPRDHQRPDRARKTTQPLAALPAVRQVLGQMRITRRHNDGGKAVARHGLAQRVDAGAHGGAAGVKGVHGARWKPGWGEV